MTLKTTPKTQVNYEHEIDKFFKSFRLDEKEKIRLIVPWQEAIPRFCKLKPYWVFWILFGQIIFLVQYLLVTFGNGTTQGLSAFGIYCIIISYAGYLPVLTARRFESMRYALINFINLDSDKIKKWYNLELKKIFSLKRNLVAFLILGVPIIISLVHLTKYFKYTEPWFDNEISDLYGMLAFTIWCFIAVHHASFVFGTVVFIDKISKLPIKVSIYQHPFISIKSIGKLLFYVSSHLIVLASLAYLGIWLSPLPLNWLTIFWMVLGGVFILAIFILPQVRIHRLMVSVKRDKILQFSEHLEKAIDYAIENPSEQLIERIEKLHIIYKHLNDMDNWPFETRALVTLITTILIPIIIALIEILVI